MGTHAAQDNCPREELYRIPRSKEFLDMFRGNIEIWAISESYKEGVRRPIARDRECLLSEVRAFKKNDLNVALEDCWPDAC